MVKKIPANSCCYPVQVRFSGNVPNVVICGKTGSWRPSLIYPHTGIYQCDEHYEKTKPTGRYRCMRYPVAELPSESEYVEQPIPGVW